jgi:hypothetical protein
MEDYLGLFQGIHRSVISVVLISQCSSCQSFWDQKTNDNAAYYQQLNLAYRHASPA